MHEDNWILVLGFWSSPKTIKFDLPLAWPQRSSSSPGSWQCCGRGTGLLLPFAAGWKGSEPGSRTNSELLFDCLAPSLELGCVPGFIGLSREEVPSQVEATGSGGWGCRKATWQGMEFCSLPSLPLIWCPFLPSAQPCGSSDHSVLGLCSVPTFPYWLHNKTHHFVSCPIPAFPSFPDQRMQLGGEVGWWQGHLKQMKDFAWEFVPLGVSISRYIQVETRKESRLKFTHNLRGVWGCVSTEQYSMTQPNKHKEMLSAVATGG